MTKAKNEKSKAEKLHCSVCETLFDFNPSGHITEDMRKHHILRKDPLVCYKCHEKGKVLVREDRQRFKARKLMCSECKKPFDFDPSGHITKRVRETHFDSRKQKVICYACKKIEDKIHLHSMRRDRSPRRLPENKLQPGPRTRQSPMLGMQRRTKKRESVHRRRL